MADNKTYDQLMSEFNPETDLSAEPELQKSYKFGMASQQELARQRGEYADQLENAPTYGEELAEDADYKDIMAKIQSTPQRTEAATSEIAQAKALSSLVANLIKAFAAAEGARKGVDMSGVNVQTGVDWDLILKGKLGAIEEEQRGLAVRREDVKMSLSDKLKMRRDAEEMRAKVAEEQTKGSTSVVLDALKAKFDARKRKEELDRTLSRQGSTDTVKAIETYVTGKKIELDDLDRQNKQLEYANADLSKQQSALSQLIKDKRTKGRADKVSAEAITATTGLDVKGLQQELIDAGNDPEVVKGWFGSNEVPLMDVQKALELRQQNNAKARSEIGLKRTKVSEEINQVTRIPLEGRQPKGKGKAEAKPVEAPAATAPAAPAPEAPTYDPLTSKPGGVYNFPGKGLRKLIKINPDGTVTTSKS
jgi:hypothetical protein